MSWRSTRPSSGCLSTDRVSGALNPIMKLRFAVALTLVLTCLTGAASSARAEGGDPVGSFDSTSVRLSGVFYYGLSVWDIYGWAADPDTPAAILDVHVYIDGQRQYVIQTGEPRPDVRAVYPFAGDNSGWHASITATTGQPHTVCAYAMNVGSGTENTTLGCFDIPAPGPNLGDPQGRLEAVTATAGLIRFQGWAGDPDTDPALPPVVRPYIDGYPYYSVESSLPRPDVRNAFPALGNAGAFDQPIAAPPGLHLYCVDAGNSGRYGAFNTSLGCGVIDVPDRDPTNSEIGGGSWDSISYTYDSTTYGGWGWDPTTNGPATVRMRDVWNSFVTVFVNSQGVQDLATGESRPDVPAAFPDAPTNPGFEISFPNVIGLLPPIEVH